MIIPKLLYGCKKTKVAIDSVNIHCPTFVFRVSARNFATLKQWYFHSDLVGGLGTISRVVNLGAKRLLDPFLNKEGVSLSHFFPGNFCRAER